MPEQKPFKTIKAFEQEIAAYFSMCETNGVFPDEAGLILYLGIDRDAYARCYNGEWGKGYAACLKKAELKRESIAVRDIYGSDKSSTGKIFVARQPENGGKSDKPKETAPKVALDVRIGGKGGQFD